MQDANTGYGKLWATVDHLLAAGLDATVFLAWHESRATDIRGTIERLARSSPHAADFISTYADSLAERLWALISADKPAAALEAAADFLEELASQTERFVGPVTQDEPVALVDDPGLPGVAIPPEYSMAA